MTDTLGRPNKGNTKATGKKARYGEELVQRSRKSILNALDVVEKKGKLISEILAEAFIANPIKFMELASKFAPKDINVEGKVKHAHEFTELERAARIDAILDAARNRGTGQIIDGELDATAGPTEGSLLQ